MKKILTIIICMFAFTVNVKAFNIYTIDMDISLDENGTATIDETWNTYVNDGSEIYHPYYNLNKSKMEMISASMDGKEYEIVSIWNESGNLNDKAYKAGLYRNEHDGYDVVVGKTTYGKHTYKFTYKITNFVSNTADYDMIYWTLIPSDFNVDNGVKIKISGPYEYPSDLPVWGYGLYGSLCYVDNGAIYMSTDDQSKPSGKNMVLLAKFPANTFNTTSKLNENFDHYLEMAEKGATSYNEKQKSWFERFIGLFVMLFQVFFWIFIVMIATRISNKSKINYEYGEEGKKLGEVPNFRDIPCNKDVFKAFFVADTYGLNKNKNDFMGVLLLKWIKAGNVTVETIDEKKMFKDKHEDVITFVKEPEDVSENERNLYRYMFEASGDGKLEKDEFKKWCKNHYSKILGWADKVLEEERKKLVSSSDLTDVVTKKGLIFKYDVHAYRIESKLKEEAKRMKGLKQFLLEFSQIDKKEPIEVKLWNEYLMYAQIFGIAEQVMKKFKDLYPEVIENMEQANFNYSTFVFVNSVSSSGVSAASAARSAAQSYSSGGGGFSSGGGGGGSFGGGFGGGSGSR